MKGWNNLTQRQQAKSLVFEKKRVTNYDNTISFILLKPQLTFRNIL